MESIDTNACEGSTVRKFPVLRQRQKEPFLIIENNRHPFQSGGSFILPVRDEPQNCNCRHGSQHKPGTHCNNTDTAQKIHKGKREKPYATNPYQNSLPHPVCILVKIAVTRMMMSATRAMEKIRMAMMAFFAVSASSMSNRSGSNGAENR